MKSDDHRRRLADKAEQIARLRKAVDDRFQGEVSDRDWAEFTRRNRSKLTQLLEEDLLEAARRQGIAIPEGNLVASSGDEYTPRNLTRDGEAWVRHEIKARRLSEAKDWIAIITPILSALIAILSLLVALQKK